MLLKKLSQEVLHKSNLYETESAGNIFLQITRAQLGYNVEPEHRFQLNIKN
jgi:hypothetical protein